MQIKGRATPKRCNHCKLTKTESDFPWVKSRNTGKLYPKSKCLDCVATTSRKSHFMRKYGVPHDEYDKMYEAQEGKCFLCNEGGPLKVEGRHRLHTDHNHDTGKLRKLLCNTCNWKIGVLETMDIDWLQGAIDYLELDDDE